jgi:hypothetical protein
MTKKDKDSQDEISELEEVIEENEIEEIAENIEQEENFVDDNQILEFLSSKKTSAPVLEQIAIAPQITNLEIGTMQGFQQEKEEEIENLYSTKTKNYEKSINDNKDKSNYKEKIAYQTETFAQPTRIDITEVGRDLNPQLRKVPFSNPEIKRKEKIFEEYSVKLERENLFKKTRSPFEQKKRRKI